jgi:transcriptional regulator of arginine metabolism
MKSERLSRILELVSSKNIKTQEELTALLNEEGYNVTQATISRDIKELRLVKATDADGNYKYSVKPIVNSLELSAKFKRILEDTVLKIDVSSSFVIIKTMPAMAQAAASSIDNMNWDEIVGTIAGDDTIFVALKTVEDAEIFCNKVKEILTV